MDIPGDTIEVSGLVGDRVEVLSVSAGEMVKEGQVIARMASRTERQLEYEAAEAQYQEAQARYESTATLLWP